MTLEHQQEDSLFTEEILLRAWLREILSNQAPVLSDIAKGGLITPFLQVPPVRTSLRRTTSGPKGRSVSSKLIRLYLLVSRFLDRPLPLLLEE